MKNLLFALAALMLAGGVNAAQMDYAYTSGPLSPSGSDGVPAVTHMTTSFTAELAPNLVFDIYNPIDVTDLIMSDGVTTIKEADVPWLFEVYASTDDEASITALEVYAHFSIGIEGFGVPHTMLLQVAVPQEDGTAQWGATTGYTVECYEYGACGEGAVATSDEVAGGVVPIPGAAWLFLPGLAGLVAVKRRQR